MPSTTSPEPVGPMVRIRDVRRLLGFTLAEMAARITEVGIPITESALSNIEAGNKAAGDQLLDAWARALDIDPVFVWHGPLRPAVTPGTPKDVEPRPPAGRLTLVATPTAAKRRRHRTEPAAVGA